MARSDYNLTFGDVGRAMRDDARRSASKEALKNRKSVGDALVVVGNLPGVGGPATNAQASALRSALDKAYQPVFRDALPTEITAQTRADAAKTAGAPAVAPVVVPKKPGPKKNPGPAGDSKVAAPPVVTGPDTSSDGTYDWWTQSDPSAMTDRARASLQGDIAVAREQSDRQQAALKAQQEGAMRFLSDFGKSVSQYYANAATKAGQGYDTQAAAQALLGALGQRAFTGQGVGSIAADLGAAGNPQLGRALASQEANRNATVGAILNRIVGTDKASEYLAASRNATRAALSNSSAQNSYGARLLQGLGVQQQNALNELLGKRADFEAKIPGMIAQRAQEMSDAAMKNMLAAKAFGLKVQGQNDLQSYRNAQLEIARQKLEQSYTQPQDKLRRTKVGDLSKDIAKWVEGERQTSMSTGQTYVTKPPLDYQQAFKKAKTTYGAFLPEDDIITLLNVAYPVRGQNGRPYLSKTEREQLIRAGQPKSRVNGAIWNGAEAAALIPLLTG